MKALKSILCLSVIALWGCQVQTNDGHFVYLQDGKFAFNKSKVYSAVCKVADDYDLDLSESNFLFDHTYSKENSVFPKRLSNAVMFVYQEGGRDPRIVYKSIDECKADLKKF